MARTVEQIEKEILSTILRRDQVNYLGPGSIVSSLVKDLSQVIQSIEIAHEQSLKELSFSTSSDEGTYTLARDYGVLPDPAAYASTSYRDKNLYLSTKDKTSLVDTFAKNNIEIYGLKITNKEGNKLYTIIGYEGDLSSSGVYVSAVSSKIGSEGNVNKGDLRFFEKAFKNLQIINKKSILNGRNKESAESVKIKSLLKLEGNKLNTGQISKILDTLDYVGKYEIFNSYAGPNTIMVCVQTRIGVDLPYSLENEIRNKLSLVIPAGKNLIVKSFDPVFFSIKTKIVAKDGQGESLSLLVASTIETYFNSLKGGSPVNLGEIELLLKQIPNLKLISRENDRLQEVSYTSYNGNISFDTYAIPSSTVTIDPTQIAILGSLIVNYE